MFVVPPSGGWRVVPRGFPEVGSERADVVRSGVPRAHEAAGAADELINHLPGGWTFLSTMQRATGMSHLRRIVGSSHFLPT